MTIKEKLKKYLDSKGVSPTAAERRLGWGVGAFTKAKSITSDRAKEFLLLFPDLSAEWLMRDEGEMIKQPLSATLDIDRIATLVDTIATLQKAMSEKDQTIALLAALVEQLKNQLNK